MLCLCIRSAAKDIILNAAANGMQSSGGIWDIKFKTSSSCKIKQILKYGGKHMAGVGNFGYC